MQAHVCVELLVEQGLEAHSVHSQSALWLEFGACRPTAPTTLPLASSCSALRQASCTSCTQSRYCSV